MWWILAGSETASSTLQRLQEVCPIPGSVRQVRFNGEVAPDVFETVTTIASSRRNGMIHLHL